MRLKSQEPLQNFVYKKGLVGFFTFCTDFVISKKKIYRFSGRIRTFYRRKTDLYEKENFRRSAVCRRRLPRKVWLPTSTLSVHVRDFCFWISD
jgi:hypothetical protein